MISITHILNMSKVFSNLKLERNKDKPIICLSTNYLQHLEAFINPHHTVVSHFKVVIKRAGSRFGLRGGPAANNISIRSFIVFIQIGILRDYVSYPILSNRSK